MAFIEKVICCSDKENQTLDNQQLKNTENHGLNPKTVRKPAFLTVSARSIRRSLRFRAGCHGLPSDVGRQTHVPRHLRVCSQCSTICDTRRLIFECTALDTLRVEYACLFTEPNPAMLSFMWQEDMHAVIRFIDVALGMSVLREAELLPNQPDVVGSV